MSDVCEGDRYRAFCAYGPHGREPGCRFSRIVESEDRAKQLVEDHERGSTCRADYELYSTERDHQ